MKNLTVKETAAILGKPENFVRVGLQTGRLPFGSAVQMTGGRWSYHISEPALKAYLTGERVLVTDDIIKLVTKQTIKEMGVLL